MFDSFFDKFRIKDDFDDEYDEYDDYSDEYEEKSPRKVLRESSYREEDDLDGGTLGKRKKASRGKTSKVVSLDRPSTVGKEVCLAKPHGFNEVEDISDKLLSGAVVVLNIEGLETPEAQRIVDFVFGTVHAINGRFMPVSAYVFVFAPENYDLSGENAEALINAVLDVPVINKGL